MGSDLSTVSIEAYREWTRDEARGRLRAYGLGPRHDAFFREEGPWVELRLHARCVHPDAPLGWDPTLVTRWVDEAVLQGARDDGSAYEFEKTPLTELFPDLWRMNQETITDLLCPVLVVEVDFRKNPRPRDGRASDPVGDTVSIALFVHHRFAPNLAGAHGWGSRAWGGGGHGWSLDPLHKASIAAEVRAVPVALRLDATDTDRNEPGEVRAIAPRARGGLWGVKATVLHEITGQGSGAIAATHDLFQRWQAMLPVGLAALPDGTLWIALSVVVVRLAPDGTSTRFMVGQEFKGKKVTALDVGPDGVAYVGTDRGLFVLGAGDTWTAAEGLPGSGVQRLVALGGGVVWVTSASQLCRRNADGSIERFQKRQGVEAHEVARLPDDSVVVVAWNHPPARVAPGASRAVTDEGLTHVLRGGLRVASVAADGTLWGILMGGLLARLREGETPRVYAWADDRPDLWGDVAQVVATREGDVWLRLGSGRLLGVRASDLAAADRQPPLNADLLARRPLAPFSLGPRPAPAGGEAAASAGEATADAGAAPAVDLRGKTVVITGTLSKLSRAEGERALSERGALLSSSVTKKTDYVLVGLRPSSKLDKARSLGIPLLDEDVLLAPPPGDAVPPAPAAPAAPEAAAPAAAATGLDARDRAARFPLSDQPIGPAGAYEVALMRQMASGQKPPTASAWKKMLKGHQDFVRTGGGGTWQVLEVSGLMLAVLGGVSAQQGAQLDLSRRRLPPGFDARNIQASWLNGCAMLAEGVDWSGAHLAHALLTDAFLAGARFDGADLTGVDFSRADLRGASFRGATLAGTDFERCDLTGADFTDARTEQARFPGARLDGVKV